MRKISDFDRMIFLSSGSYPNIMRKIILSKFDSIKNKILTDKSHNFTLLCQVILGFNNETCKEKSGLLFKTCNVFSGRDNFSFLPISETIFS